VHSIIKHQNTNCFLKIYMKEQTKVRKVTADLALEWHHRHCGIFSFIHLKFTQVSE